MPVRWQHVLVIINLLRSVACVHHLFLCQLIYYPTHWFTSLRNQEVIIRGKRREKIKIKKGWNKEKRVRGRRKEREKGKWWVKRFEQNCVGLWNKIQIYTEMGTSSWMVERLRERELMFFLTISMLNATAILLCLLVSSCYK